MKIFKKLHFPSTTKSRMFLLFLATYLPLLICILIGSRYGEHLLKEQSIRYNHNTISLQLTTIDAELSHISNYLASFLLEKNHSEDSWWGHQSLDSQIEIRNDFTQYLNTYSSCGTLFFYLPGQDVFLLQTANYDTFKERQAMEQYVRETCRAKDIPSQKLKSTDWSLLQNQNQNYLVQIMEYRNVYVGSWEVCQYAFEDFRTLEKSTRGTLIISDQADQELPVFSSPEAGVSLTRQKDYVTIPVDSVKNQYRLTFCIPEKYVLDAFVWFQYVALILMFSTVLVFAILLFGIWRQMAAPLIRMIHAMKAVQAGDFNAPLPVPDTQDEFAELTETFNYMISQIHTLKIQVYEEKLHQVYAELQYLTLQIKPHFFLNCLNLIYSLGLSGRSALVAEFSSTLMKYFRYLFKGSHSMVSIAEELTHVENYLHIQTLRFQSELDCQFDIQESARTMEIPVLLLHTFVENIFKHAYTNDKKLLIRISAKTIYEDHQPYLLLSIQDNGKGYPQDKLAELNQLSEEPLTGSEEENHIGISNVKQRLLHIYGSSLYLRFENLPQGGAGITLGLPQHSLKLTQEETHR